MPSASAKSRARRCTRSDAAGRISREKLVIRPWSWRIISYVFLPFAAGYYLSYLFRMINTLICGRLASEFELGTADLGLLASIYFLIVTGSQIPLGILLDRFGPRRVQSALLLLAAAGAALFGLSSGFLSLLLGRAMIAFGTAASLMSGLKTIVLWFPRERVALVNGYMIMLGALGAVTATAPAEALLNWIGWRGLFEVLAASSATAAAVIYFLVPEQDVATTSPRGIVSLKTVYTDGRFWRIAPISSTCIGSAWALQSLWAASWLSDVEGLDRASLVTQLLIMAIALSIGALLLGAIADSLRRHGKNIETLLAIIAAVFIAAELALILHPPFLSLPSWIIVAVVGSAIALSYAIIGDYFPAELIARANGVLNVLHFGWAFLVQYGTGLILEQWPAKDGHYPSIAYQTAFSINVLLQLAALVWFIAPWLKKLNWKSQIALKRKSTDQSRSVHVVIPSAEMVILETDQDREW
ncbi:MFS transporter [Bradyrhizobium sp. SSUT112]|uniref:MFS transporter n=1 Tax=Bradyrhizobium sp. SSUT112 TaxID=3040604 RepID=UPI002449BE2F|nr:MFS transporter [Bradyrhizobium sp. SSUT112]MDH2356713.1 MFS transporter [Bradyrhizobium sp. SSUT112]